MDYDGIRNECKGLVDELNATILKSIWLII